MYNSQISKLEEKTAKLKERLEQIEKRKTRNNICKKEGITKVIENLDKENAELNQKIAEFAKDNQEDQTYIDNLNTDITD